MDSVKKINSGEILNFDEAKTFFAEMLDDSLTEAQIASTLISMKHRGETADELAALVSELNKHKKKFKHNSKKTVDTCGTGGDGKSTVNVSTAVSIILASLGYNVVKHGNTAQSGKVGSADILISLGLDLNYKDITMEEFYKKHNFIFMLAPHFHPALKGIGKVRREIKVATIFNYVGPLVNPADPDYQIIGINKKEKLEFVAKAIQKIGKNNITIYSSEDGYDEVSSNGKTNCIEIKNNNINSFEIDPSKYFSMFEMPVVNDSDEAKKMFLDGLKGEDNKIVNIFSINAALALKNMNEGELGDAFEKVKKHLLDGKAYEKLQEIVK